MSNWQFIVTYFNSKRAGKLFTRAEFLSHVKSNFKYPKINTLQTYINTLKRAGYLEAEEPGVYRKLKKIPNISETQMKKDIKYNHLLFSGERAC